MRPSLGKEEIEQERKEGIGNIILLQGEEMIYLILNTREEGMGATMRKEVWLILTMSKRRIAKMDPFQIKMITIIIGLYISTITIPFPPPYFQLRLLPFPVNSYSLLV